MGDRGCSFKSKWQYGVAAGTLQACVGSQGPALQACAHGLAHGLGHSRFKGRHVPRQFTAAQLMCPTRSRLTQVDSTPHGCGPPSKQAHLAHSLTPYPQQGPQPNPHIQQVALLLELGPQRPLKHPHLTGDHYLQTPTSTPVPRTGPQMSNTFHALSE